MMKVKSSYVATTCFKDGWFELTAVESVILSDAASCLRILSRLSDRSPCFAAIIYYLLLLVRSGVTSSGKLVPF